jgi:membrane fusion protein, copper/silver efflux system
MRYLIVMAIILALTACKGKQKEVTTDPDVFYTCSMHPQVMQDRPGKCPICRMDLIAVKKGQAQMDDQIMLSDQQMQLGNIKVDTIGKDLINEQTTLTATLNFDQTKISSVSARVGGRIERLYFKNAGDYIRKGDSLYDLYSEELNNAKQEYILALERQKILDNSQIDFNQLIQSAKNKLLLWGMSEKQIQELTKNKKSSSVSTFYSNVSGYLTNLEIHEGEYIPEGGMIVRLADLSSLWAETQVYTSQLASIDRNGVAIVHFPELNGKSVSGKIEFVNPEINPNTRVNLVRIIVPNSNNQLRPGMLAYVMFKNRQRNSLTLPADAVIRNGDHSVVWTRTAHNTFKVIMVKTGSEMDGTIEILSGLQQGDQVVTNGAYLINSEYIFKRGASPMAGHDM